LTNEFDKIVNPRKKRDFSPQSALAAQAQFQHNMYRNTSNTLAFEIFQRTCQIYAFFIRQGVQEANNGNPNNLLELMIGPGYVGTMLGDVIGVAKCFRVHSCKFFTRNGTCTVEWPIEFLADGSKRNGWMTPGHEIIYELTYVSSCGIFFFTDESGISYNLLNNTQDSSFTEMPHTSNLLVPVNLGIPEIIPTAPGIYTRTELTDHANVFGIMREIRRASQLEKALQHYEDGIVDNTEESLIDQLYNATVKPLADKLTAFFATAGTLVTLVAIVGGLYALGLLQKVLTPILNLFKPGNGNANNAQGGNAPLYPALPRVRV